MLKFSVGNWGFFFYFFFCFTSAFCQLFTTYWVSKWTDEEFEEQQKSIYPQLFGYSLIVFMILNFMRGLTIFLILQFSTTRMHNRMVETVIRAKVLFFDSNPIGRIYTRFSKDVNVLDLILPNLGALATFGIFRSITVTMVVCVIHPSMLVVLAVAFAIMTYLMIKAAGVLREAQRMDSLYRGPIHSTFTNIVNGLVSLRTYERLNYFRVGFID